MVDYIPGSGFDDDDDRLSDFTKTVLTDLMTPERLTIELDIMVATPLDIGQAILNNARNGEYHQATLEAEDYISFLCGVEDGIHEVLELELQRIRAEGFEVKSNIPKKDSEELGHAVDCE